MYLYVSVASQGLYIFWSHLDVLWFLFPICFNSNRVRHMFIGFSAQIHICFKSLGWMTFCDLWRSPGDDSDWTQWWRSCDWGAESQGRWTIVWARAKRRVLMEVAGCLWVFWDGLRKTQHALQSEGTVFTHNTSAQMKTFQHYKSLCRMLRMQAAQSWRLPVHGLFGSGRCQELHGQVGDVWGQPEFVWSLFSQDLLTLSLHVITLSRVF